MVGDSIRSLFPARSRACSSDSPSATTRCSIPALERDFRASGLSHLLVVSGGNVAMVLAPVLGLGALLRLSRWPRFALGLGTVAFFVVLTGAEPSVLRAGVDGRAHARSASSLGRPRSAASILAAAVFVLS